MFNLIFDIFRRSRVLTDEHVDDSSVTLTKAIFAVNERDYSSAIPMLEYLKSVNPTDLEVIRYLAGCYELVGRKPDADALYDQAFHLDDTHSLFLYHKIYRCIDQCRSKEALDIICQARASDPRLLITNYGAGRLAFAAARHEVAPAHYLSAWLGNFEDLRLANARLFGLSYVEEDEAKLTAEHRFWAETMKPAEPISSKTLIQNSSTRPVNGQNRRIRLGYWSSDFREHSVRYFFRPMIESHDRSQFEVFCYHDIPIYDKQTFAIKSVAERFYDVSDLSDEELISFISGHSLDILVELSGHTSNNRLPLLRQRLAPIQITALGYPPSTGLKSIDFKVFDPYTFADQGEHLYAEQPLKLSHSFWCFDPREDIPIRNRRNSVELKESPIIFACFGNAGKITTSILHCWLQILKQVPNSILKLRSVHFADDFSKLQWECRLEAAGFPMTRVDLLPPLSSQDFFDAYNEIDIVLDTYPFNGGTTTCFATYMGALVVSKYGKGLRSRMGLSVLSNLGVPEFAVDTFEKYVDTAVRLANDREILDDFKATARYRFQNSHLGNAKLYTRDFERALIDLLQNNHDKPMQPRLIPRIAGNELVRRAYFVSSSGNAQAAARIISHALDCDPANIGAQIYLAQDLSANSPLKAIDDLLSLSNRCNRTERTPVVLELIRLLIKEDRIEDAREHLESLNRDDVSDEIDRSQISLFDLLINKDDFINIKSSRGCAGRTVRFIIPCEDEQRKNYLKSHFERLSSHSITWKFEFEFCAPDRRWLHYKNASDCMFLDMVIMMTPNIELFNLTIIDQLSNALCYCDVVGYYGARRWNFVDWRSDVFDQKAGCAVYRTSHLNRPYELTCFGPYDSVLAGGMAVLDGNFIATRPNVLSGLMPDRELEKAGSLMEEYWSHQAYLSGLKLGVHPKLGIFKSAVTSESVAAMAIVRRQLMSKLDLDPLSPDPYNFFTVSVPLRSLDECNIIMNSD